MDLARDPALFFSVYLHKQSAGSPDARVAILEQVDAFVDRYSLVTDTNIVPCSRASSIILSSADRTSPEFNLLFRARAGYTQPPSGTGYEVLIYAWHDALVVQIQVAKFQDWRGTPLDGWQENACRIRQAFDPRCLSHAASSVFGVSTVYWFIADQHKQPGVYEEAIGDLFETGDVEHAAADVGLLWSSDDPFFEKINIHQDRWILVSPRHAEAEVNKRYYWRSPMRPPDFAVLALARHKIFFEINEYWAMRADLESPARMLEQETFLFLENQRRLDSELEELLSDRAIQFQHNLVRASNRLADYRNWTGRLKELRRTIAVNRRNYLYHSVCLLSDKGGKRVERSVDRQQAAIEFLDSYSNDGIFSTDLGTIGQNCDQLDTDIGYAESLIERHTAILRSATDQLRVAGERDIAETAHHMSVDSAAVVASLGALIAIELAAKPHWEKINTQIDDRKKQIADYKKKQAENKRNSKTEMPLGETATAEPKEMYHNYIEFWAFVGFIVFGLYGGTQALAARFRGRKPGKKSIIGAFALACAWLAAVFLNHRFSYEEARELSRELYWDKHYWAGAISVISIAIVLGALLGFVAYELAWRHAQKNREKNLRTREGVAQKVKHE